ncbi:MAG: hypothetical protein OEL76_15670 [Siculibacillus sp.]|nr:hypothetical protein [Siculibacillus sp.]
MTEFESNPTSSIDWKYWCSIPAWTIKEAVCLFLSIDPDQYVDNTMIGETEDFRKLHRFFRRAKELDEIDSLTPPVKFINWAISRNIKTPIELQILKDETSFDEYKEKYLALKKKIRILRKKLKRAEAGIKTIDSDTPKRKSGIYRIILTIAEKHYGFSPNRNSAAKSIASDILLNGMQSPKEETVRNILIDAYEYVTDHGRD